MKYFWICILVCGCQAVAVEPSRQATAALGHLDQIKQNAVDARGSLANVSNELSRGQVASAAGGVKEAFASVTRIEPLVDQAKGETGELSDERDALARLWETHKDDLKNYKSAHENDWLGPRAHRWLIWICVGGSLLGIGYVLLMAAGEMEGGALAGAMNLAGHVLTLGLKFVGKLLGKGIVWIVGELDGVVGKVGAMLERASPRPAAAPAK